MSGRALTDAGCDSRAARHRRVRRQACRCGACASCRMAVECRLPRSAGRSPPVKVPTLPLRKRRHGRRRTCRGRRNPCLDPVQPPPLQGIGGQFGPCGADNARKQRGIAFGPALHRCCGVQAVHGILKGPEHPDRGAQSALCSAVMRRNKEPKGHDRNPEQARAHRHHAARGTVIGHVPRKAGGRPRSRTDRRAAPRRPEDRARRSRPDHATRHHRPRNPARQRAARGRAFCDTSPYRMAMDTSSRATRRNKSTARYKMKLLGVCVIRDVTCRCGPAPPAVASGQAGAATRRMRSGRRMQVRDASHPAGVPSKFYKHDTEASLNADIDGGTEISIRGRVVHETPCFMSLCRRAGHGGADCRNGAVGRCPGGRFVHRLPRLRGDG